MGLKEIISKAKDMAVEAKKKGEEKYPEGVEKLHQGLEKIKEGLEKLQKEAGNKGYKAGGAASCSTLKWYAEFCLKLNDPSTAARSYRMAMKTALEIGDENQFIKSYLGFNSKCKTADDFLDYKQELKQAFEEKFGKTLESCLE